MVLVDFVGKAIHTDIILSARKIYSRGCTSKKIGAIIKEKAEEDRA